MNSIDFETVRALERKVGRSLHQVWEGDRCVELALTAEDCLFHGLIRRHSALEKEEVMALVCRLTGLKKLDLRRNKLGRLPDGFAALDQLEHLVLGSNYFGEVPVQIRGLRRLKFLHLGNNDLTKLPAFVSEFDRLEYLALHKNLKLKAIDPIAGLRNLQALNLYFLNLGGLPSFVYDLSRLVTLTLCHTSNLSDDVGRLANLQFFTCCCSPGMRQFPAGITQLKNLRMIRAFQNGIESLPEGLGELRKLEQISVYQNKINRLPDSMAGLLHLRKLNLGWNELTELPPWLPRLPQLEWLAIFQNPLKTCAVTAFTPNVRVVRNWPFSTLPPS